MPCSLLCRILLIAGPLAGGVCAQSQPDRQPPSRWHYGGFADMAYLYDFNSPANHLFRNRGTAAYVDETELNMAGVYARKDASEKSRWGMELTIHGGKDSEAFGFSATAPKLKRKNGPLR